MATTEKPATIKVLHGDRASEYTIGNLQYPIDLDSEQYNGHRVLFFINASASGKFAEKRREEFQSEPPSDSYVSRPSSIGGTLQDATGVSSVAGVTVSPKTKRMKYAISLYVPNDLSSSFSTQWSEEDMGTAASATAELLGGLGGENKQNAKEVPGLVSTLGSMAGSVLVNKSQVAQRAARMNPGNSKSEQLFKSVDYRSFNFNYQFAPRTEVEAANVMNIVNMFRHHMLPEYADAARFLFVYPSEFDIKYIKVDEKGVRENEFLDKHFTAVLTNCVINYAPLGQFSTFKNGMPTQINMSLTFKELALPTKETFEEPNVGQFKDHTFDAKYSASGDDIRARK